ncbi:MAG: hypothetical protein MUP85_08995 [Candidatus Lokiarchaeota archaeon]|nr:hypothetical protein [Candidatus Lokiarchaeota archaeon]
MKLKIYFPLIIFSVNLIFYAIFSYGGIRSPDSEIVFRTTESLVLRNEFAVQEAIDWTFFGLGPGIDNERYSIFGPAQSILTIPLLKFAYYLQKNGRQILDSSQIPISFHVKNNDRDAGLYFLEGKRPTNLGGHFERFIVSFFNVLVGAFSGVFLYLVLLKITESYSISFYTTFVYSFGSLIFSYTGTFFSEPLCTLFVILSFLFILKNEKDYQSIKYENKNYFYSGLFLGLAITTHISALLSVPFYYLFILGQKSKNKLDLKRFWISSLYFSVGLAMFCILLFYYNYIRFGNIFETGRFADSLYHYAIYVNPLEGLFGLLFSSGKGLLIYSPIVLLGVIFWQSFHKRYPHLSIAILGMIFIRIIFISSRSDWHAGFSLGPRYLLIIIPFIFIPIALGLKNIIESKKIKSFLMFGLFSFLCLAQQIFLSLGEIFSYLHIVYRQQKELGVGIIANKSLYLNWEYSPTLYLLNYKTGPFLLKLVSTNNYLLWLWMVITFAIIFFTLSYLTYKSFSNINNR